MTVINEEYAKALSESGNFFVVDFDDDIYLLKVGQEKYFVRLHEEEIELKNSKQELVKGFKSTLYDAFDNSEIFTREDEVSLESVVLDSTDGFEILGKKAFLLKLLTPSQKRALDDTIERQRKYQELINKCISSGVDLSDAYYFKVNKTPYIVRFEERLVKIHGIQEYEYTFYNLLDNSFIAKTTRSSKLEVKEFEVFYVRLGYNRKSEMFMAFIDKLSLPT